MSWLSFETGLVAYDSELTLYGTPTTAELASRKGLGVAGAPSPAASRFARPIFGRWRSLRRTSLAVLTLHAPPNPAALPSQAGRIANYFSAIIRSDSALSTSILVSNGHKLTDAPNKKRLAVVRALRKADEWKKRLQNDASVTQSDIAKEEGMCRTRVSQLLQLTRLSQEVRRKIEFAPEQLTVPINIHSLRRLAITSQQKAQPG